jgi:hypothetical protein
MPQPSFKFYQALYCDDYRVEVTGKGFVIGLLSNVIFFSEFPITFEFTVCLVGEAKDDFSIEVRTQFIPEHDGKPITIGAEAGGKINELHGRDSVAIFLPLRKNKIRVDCEGVLITEVRTNKKGARWKKIGQLDITQKSSSSESVLPS